MSWTKVAFSSPLTDNISGVWYGCAGRWLLNDGNGNFRIGVTADFVTFDTFFGIPTPGFDLVDSATFDGTRWYLLSGTTSGLFRSTDGATGAAWERITPDFSGGSSVPEAQQVFATLTGRLLSRHSRFGTDYISYSDNAGATWTTAAGFFLGNVSAGDQTALFQLVDGGAGIAIRQYSNEFYISGDNGVTWTTYTATGLLSASGGVAKIGSNIVAADFSNDASPRVSADNGATWGAVPGFRAARWLIRQASNGAVYALDTTFADPQLWYTTDLVTWTQMDLTGMTQDWFRWSSTYMNVDGPLIVLDASTGSSDKGVYFAASPTDGPPGPGPAASIDLPLRLEVQGSPAISLPVRLQVGSVSASALPLRLSVLTPTVLAGLNGAGGWPAAVDGQWRPVVLLDGVDISHLLLGECVVTHADNEARVADFAFRPAAPMMPMDLIGAPVRLSMARRGSSGEALDAQILFSGVIETPEVDARSGVIRCVCHDLMQEVFSNTPRAWTDANIGGRWRVEVSGEPVDGWDYVEARRASVPVSVALDALQQPRVLPWRGLPVVTVRDADIIDGAPQVALPSRYDLRTRMTVRLQYRYQRLRARGVVASYNQSREFYTGYAGADGDPIVRTKQFLTTAMIQGAAEGLRGWSLQSLSLDQSQPGNYPLGPVLSDGVFELRPEVAPTLAWGFTARYQARWVQTVTEDVSVTVRLPALEASLGVIQEEIGAAFAQAFDSRDWASNPQAEPPLPVTVGDAALAWEPESGARDEVLRTLLDRAWVRLWSASRTGRVTFGIPLRPSLWLDTDVRVESAKVNAQGKVVFVEHRMNVDTGEATTTASIAIGLPGQTDQTLPTWTVPARPSFSVTTDPAAFSFEIGTFVGGRASSPPWSEDNVGFSTNLINPMIGAQNFYPYQLSIRSPEIAAADRDPQLIEQAATLDVAIPTDTLEFLP